MSNPVPSSSFFTRFITNDAARRGVAAALAGMIVAAISETLWPSQG